MRILDSSTKELLRHSVRHFVVAAVAFCFAVALDLLHHMFARWGLSPWLLVGIDCVARFIFAIESFVICCIVTMTALHSIREFAHRMQKRR